MALFCQQRLQRTLVDEPRTTIPIPLEIEAVKDQKPIIIRVYFLDNTFKTIAVESFTGVGELVVGIARKIKLREDRIPEFGLYELLPDGDTNLLKYEEKVLDVLGAWEMEDLRQEKAVERKLWEEDEKITAKAMREKQKLREEMREDRELQKGDEEIRTKRIVFKRKIYMPSMENNFTDPVIINLHYIQAIHDVYLGNQPVSEQEAVKLAALRVLATFGPDAPSEIADLEGYLPRDMYPTRSDKEWEEKILMEHIQLPTMEQLATKMKYLNMVNQWHCFSSGFFEAEQDQYDELPPKIFLAVNSKGIHLLKEDTKELLASYDYGEICSWAFSNTTFTVLIGNSTHQQRVIFSTSKGCEISTICTEYVNFLVEDIDTPQTAANAAELADFDESGL
eukprot:GFYU01015193.1.p1 GENE.GFYU01015193.1~~GFYU01015193.1.p1  ORF type:complete len:456 (-),score=160.57 GFYU01015193.1:207-1388(-)